MKQEYKKFLDQVRYSRTASEENTISALVTEFSLTSEEATEKFVTERKRMVLEQALKIVEDEKWYPMPNKYTTMVEVNSAEILNRTLDDIKEKLAKVV